MRTFALLECADFLKVDRNKVLKLAGRGELPGAKIGRAWVFLEDDVVTYLRKNIQEQTAARLEITSTAEANEQLARAIARQLPIQAPRRRGRRPRPLPSLPPLPEESATA